MHGVSFRYLGVVGSVVVVVATLLATAMGPLEAGRVSLAGQIPTVAPGSERREIPPSDEGEITLPQLPPLHVRYPNLYDEQGCARLPEAQGGGVDCGAPPISARGTETLQDAEMEEAGKPRLAWSSFLGFSGPYYTARLDAGQVSVVHESVLVEAEGPWQAKGLVRNEQKEPVSNVVVKAALLARDGSVLDLRLAAVPVDPLRAGEPGPFVVTSQVDAGEVAAVEWSVEATSAGQRVPPEAREVELMPFWELARGTPSAVRTGLQQDGLQGNGDPYILYGSVQNLGRVALPGPAVVAAWLDESGRVVWVAETPLVDLAPGRPPLASLQPGDVGDFAFAVDVPAAASDLYGLSYMLWGVGR